jgi:hypothetical protein
MKPAKICEGDVVVAPFPFSDLTEAKGRPALVDLDVGLKKMWPFWNRG